MLFFKTNNEQCACDIILIYCQIDVLKLFLHILLFEFCYVENSQIRRPHINTQSYNLFRESLLWIHVPIFIKVPLAVYNGVGTSNYESDKNCKITQ